MSNIAQPKEKYRIALSSEIPPIAGVYIVAYLGRVMYVGKAEYNVYQRLAGHRGNALHELFGAWMVRNCDWHNVRLDILTPPDYVDMRWWLKTVECACIRELTPLLNQQLQTI